MCRYSDKNVIEKNRLTLTVSWPHVAGSARATFENVRSEISPLQFCDLFFYLYLDVFYALWYVLKLEKTRF